MSLEVDGFDSIFNTLDSLGNVGTKIGKSVIKDGLEEVLIELKSEAPKDTGKSAESLQVQYVKNNRNGSAWGSCGIGSKNWEKTKGLWFQNFGYTNGKTTVTKNIGWMTRIFSKAKNRVYDNMLKKLSSEIDKAMKG